MLYQILEKFNIASQTFRKILATVIGLMIFGLLFAIVKFMKLEIPNFTRNILMLASIDIGGFFFLVFKQNQQDNNENTSNNENKPNNIPTFKSTENKNNISDTYDNKPADNKSINDTIVDNTPVDNTPVDNTPVDITPVDITPVDNTPIDDKTVNNTHVDNEKK